MIIDIPVLPLTASYEYNFFFTLVMVAGLVAILFNMVTRILSRS